MFDENQIFYAALWWMAHLPGGSANVPGVLARYGKEPVAFPPCEIKRGRKEADPFEMSWEEIEELEDQIARGYNPADAILPPEKLDVFFDSLLEAVRHEKPDYTATGHNRYLELRQSFGVGSNHPAYPDFPFSDALESAIAAAGIHRHALPQKEAVYAHDDGQLFVPQQDGQWTKRVSLDYPGRPVLPYRPVEMKAADMDHCPTLTWETLYRVVPLQQGQSYKTGYISVSGSRQVHERTAHGADEVLVVGNNDVEDMDRLWSLSDGEIIDFHPDLRGSMQRDAEGVRPGHKDPLYPNQRVEAGRRPNSVRVLHDNIAFMIATEAVQIGCGSDFSVAQPGDFIIRESAKSRPRVMARGLIDAGRVRFILPPAAKAPKAGPSGPCFN